MRNRVLVISETVKDAASFLHGALQTDTQTFTWPHSYTLTTKYYSAALLFHALMYSDHDAAHQLAPETDAVILLVSSPTASTHMQAWHTFLDTHVPAITALVYTGSDAWMSEEQLDAWEHLAFDMGCEFINVSQGNSADSCGDVQGYPRVLEMLSGHVWEGHVMHEDDDKKGNGKEEATGVAKEISSFFESTPGLALLQGEEEEAATHDKEDEKDGEDAFEAMSKLAAFMRTLRERQMSRDDRHTMAEQFITQFAKHLDLNEDDL